VAFQTWEVRNKKYQYFHSFFYIESDEYFYFSQTMKEERKQKAEGPNVVPVIETTPPSPHTANGTPVPFNGSALHTGRRASEPVSDNLLDLNDYHSERSSSFSDVPSVQLTPPSKKRLTLVCALTIV
jgi:hypothetical protein